MSTLILYTTDGCHLCGHAEQMLVELKTLREIIVEPVDISSDEKLVALYGFRIPVVKNKLTEQEIGWPFQLSDLASLV